MQKLTLLVLLGLSACAAPIEKLVVPALEPVCYALICEDV
jgi:hypothetical protein